MKNLFNYLKGKALWCAILAPLFMCVEVAMDLLQPTLMSQIIDIGIANHDMDYVLSAGGKMLAVAVVGLIGGIGCGLMSSIAAIHLAQSVREALFAKLQTFSFIELDRFKTSSLITRLTNDVTQVQQTVMMGLRVAVRAPLMCLGGIIMATLLSKELAVVFLAVIPLILLFVVLICLKTFPLFRGMQEKIDQVNKIMRENLLGIRVIKAFTMEDTQKKYFGEANDDLMGRSIKAQNITMLLMPIVMLIVNLSVVIVLWYGGQLANEGRIETGKIMAFINYLIQIMHSLMMVVMLVINFSRAKVSADRINEVLEVVPSIKDSGEAKTIESYDVEFRDVSFRYHPPGDYVLKNISFNVEEGEKIGIIGSTGSGKSSLVGLISRLYDVSSGAVLIGGKDVRHLKLKDLREYMGVVLQESILFSGTIDENLRFGNEKSSTEEIEKATRDAQAYEFVSQKEEGYESIVEQRGKNLSGGQKQRLSIARTLLKNVHILILDDATSALDMRTEGRLQEALKERMTGKTVFTIAQRISSVVDSDKIIVLEDGEISGIGTHKQLLSSNDIYRSIAISQLGEEILSDVE